MKQLHGHCNYTASKAVQTISWGLMLYESVNAVVLHSILYIWARQFINSSYHNVHSNTTWISCSQIINLLHSNEHAQL